MAQASKLLWDAVALLALNPLRAESKKGEAE
jgi:hypothetical protein